MDWTRQFARGGPQGKLAQVLHAQWQREAVAAAVHVLHDCVSAHKDCNARMEPSSTSVAVAAVGRQGARADIEVPLPPTHSPTLLDISMMWSPICFFFP
jgi:hypothetical protein